MEPYKVLLVEPDCAARQQSRRVLESAGYSVTDASDEPAAFHHLRSGHIDLVLLDYRASKGRDRLELIRLRSAHTWRLLQKTAGAAELLEAVRKALSAPPLEIVSASPDWMELLVPCNIESAEQAQELFSLLNCDLPAQTGETVARVFHELLSNAVEWGGRFDAKSKVRASCLRGRRMVLCRIADPGAGFRDEALPHAAVSNRDGDALEHMNVRAERGLRPGGFGLLIARAMVDELIYNEAHNEVVFIKYLCAG
ncbi:MAG: ATP-binding protein [Acidobacteria bacterium]|nr:ATP-binding protein [Acidobacteriota bacterium]